MKIIVAGIIEPPPAMVIEITRMAQEFIRLGDGFFGSKGSVDLSGGV